MIKAKYGKLAGCLIKTLKLLGDEPITKNNILAPSLIDNDLMNEKLFLKQYRGSQLIHDSEFMKFITKNCKNANELFEPLYNDRTMTKVLQSQNIKTKKDNTKLKNQITMACKPRNLNSQVLFSRIENRLLQIYNFYENFVQKKLSVTENYNLLNEIQPNSKSKENNFHLKYSKRLFQLFNDKSAITIFFKLKNPNISNIEIIKFSEDLNRLNNQLITIGKSFQKSKSWLSKDSNDKKSTTDDEIEQNLVRYNLHKHEKFFKLNKLDEYTLLHALKLYEFKDMNGFKTFEDLQNALQKNSDSSLIKENKNNFIFDYFFDEIKEKFSNAIKHITYDHYNKNYNNNPNSNLDSKNIRLSEVSVLRSIMKNYYSISINFPVNNNNNNNQQLSQFYKLLNDNQDLLELLFTQINYKKIPQFLNLNLLEFIKSKKESEKSRTLIKQISQNGDDNQVNDINKSTNFFEYLAAHDITLIKKPSYKNCIYFYKQQNKGSKE